MWWVNQLTKVFTYAVILEKPGKYAEPTKSLLACKPFCALSALHYFSCFSLLFLAPIHTEPSFISLPVLSHTAVPTALPSACSPSYPVVSHPAPLCILISACFHPCSLSQTSPAVLLTSHCILPHVAPASSLTPIISQFEAVLPHLSIIPCILVIFSLHLLSSPSPSVSPRVCPYYILRRPQTHTSLCACWSCSP